MYPHGFPVFHSWVLDFLMNIQHSEIILFEFSAKHSCYNLYTVIWNSLPEKNFNSFETFMTTSFEVDIKLPVETHRLHLKMKVIKKQLNWKWNWNSSRSNNRENKNNANKKYTAKSTANPWSFLLWDFYRQVQIPTRELQHHFQHFFELYSLKQTQVDNDRLSLQHQKRVEATNQTLRKKELECNKWINLTLKLMMIMLLRKILNWYI